MTSRPAMRSALALATAISMAAVSSASAQQTGAGTDTTGRAGATSSMRMRVTKESGGSVSGSANMQGNTTQSGNAYSRTDTTGSMSGNVSGNAYSGTDTTGRMSGNMSGGVSTPAGGVSGGVSGNASVGQDSLRASGQMGGQTTGQMGTTDTTARGVASTGTTSSTGVTTGNLGSVGPAGSRTTTDSVPQTPGNAGMPAAQTGVAGGDVAAGGAGSLTLGNVAAIATASNMNEIQTSQLALERAQDPSVKNFAQAMIAEHQAIQAGMDSLLAQKGVTPQDNELSQQMKTQLSNTLQQLQSASGQQFDMQYMMHQVQSHQMTLNALDEQLIPASASDPEMQAVLRDVVRPRVADHLEQARRIHDALMTRGS